MALPKAVRSLLRVCGLDEAFHYKLRPTSNDALREWASRNNVRPMIHLEAYEFIRQMEPHIAAALDSGEAGMIREDLYPTILMLLLESQTDRELVALLKSGLTQDQQQMLKVAMAAASLRSGGLDQEATALVDDAARRLGPDARKFNALYSAGYVQAMFAWHMAYYRMINPERSGALFSDWLSKQLEFFEIAVFINLDATVADVVAELEARLINHPGGKPVRQVRALAAGDFNMMTAAQAVRRFINKHPSFQFGCEDSKYGSARSMEIMIFDPHFVEHHRKGIPHDVDVFRD